MDTLNSPVDSRVDPPFEVGTAGVVFLDPMVDQREFSQAQICVETQKGDAETHGSVVVATKIATVQIEIRDGPPDGSPSGR